jgi:hypothetical protein
VEKASEPLTVDKIYPRLTAVIPGNEDLIWENDSPGSRVLVAVYTWGINPAPENIPTDTYALKTNKWVTVAPELFNFFQISPYSSTRIEQLLGLPPCYGNTKIIEMYVDPLYMFRPAPDPETTDRTVSVDFPWKTSRIVSYNAANTIYDDFCGSSPCYSDYETWFNNRRAGIYTAGPPYPWTGLGYTYDWGPSRPHLLPRPAHVGLSEFVVTPSVVGILRISDAADYFRPHKQTLTVQNSGSGRVSSLPLGIRCGYGWGNSCSKTFRRYARITLTALPSSTSRFEGWEGACAYAGSNPVCSVTMADDKAAIAVFVSK